MTVAHDLLRQVEAVGGLAEARGGKLRLTAPRPLPDELIDELRQHKAEVLAVLRPAGADAHTIALAEWGDAAEAVAWFLASEPPSEPFVPRRNAVGLPSITVLHPARYWRAFRAALAAGPGRGRDAYGAVTADVLRIYELFGCGA